MVDTSALIFILTDMMYHRERTKDIDELKLIDKWINMLERAI